MGLEGLTSDSKGRAPRGCTVRMQPLKLRMQGHPIIRGALRLLEFRRGGSLQPSTRGLRNIC